MAKTIWFDLDGTIVDLYNFPNWLDYLHNEDTLPYEKAKPCFNMSIFAKKCKALQRIGFQLGVISWASKNGDGIYNYFVADAKKKWLQKHLPSVKFKVVIVTEYGEKKHQFKTSSQDILIDDNDEIRKEWIATGSPAYSPTDLFSVLDILKKHP